MPRKPKPFACYLCVRAGRESGPQSAPRSHVCSDCVELFKLKGKRWCNIGRHMVDRTNWSPWHNECSDCQLDRDRRRFGRVPPPPGYVRLTDIANQLRIPRETVSDWVKRGWMREHRHDVGKVRWLKKMDRYPEPPRGKRGPKGPWKHRKEHQHERSTTGAGLPVTQPHD